MSKKRNITDFFGQLAPRLPPRLRTAATVVEGGVRLARGLNRYFRSTRPFARIPAEGRITYANVNDGVYSRASAESKSDVPSGRLGFSRQAPADFIASRPRGVNRYQGRSGRMPKRYRSSRKRSYRRRRRTRKGRRSVKRRRYTRKGGRRTRKRSLRFKRRVQEIINCSSDQQYELFYDNGLFTNLNRPSGVTTGGSTAMCWMVPDFDGAGAYSGIPSFPYIKDVQFLVAQHPPSGASTFKRIEIVSAFHETEFVNCGTHPFEMKIYFFRSRSAESTHSPFFDASLSLQDESNGATASETSINFPVTGATPQIYNLAVGLTPYMLPRFCQAFKIVGTKTKVMKMGRVWKVKQRLRKCKRYSSADFDVKNQCLPWATNMLISIRGLPQSEASTVGTALTIKDGEATLAWISNRKYNFSIFNAAAPEINVRTSSIIGAMTTANLKTWPTQLVETVAAPAYPAAAI